MITVGALAQQPAPAPAAVPKEPPPAAYLRIETGRHGAAINRLAFARAANLVASVSDDKTARLWDATTGELVTVLRVPVADGLEGALYSVALSPDGTRLLAAGYTGIAWDGRPSVYVFDVASERMVGRLGPLPAIVNHMAFAPDGKRFALSLGKAGVSLHEANGKPIAQDREFQDQATWVAFAADGRWAASGLDGDVRLYDADGKRLARHKLAGAGRPFSVEFSPSGEILAVGFVDRPRVEILSLPDLAPRFAPPVGDLKSGGLSTVAFVPAGATTHLVASGSARGADGKIALRRWADSGLGRPVDEAVADDTVTQVVPLDDGRIALATAEPSLEIGPLIAKAGDRPEERHVLASNNLDLRNVVRGRLATDRTGTRILIVPDKDKPPIVLDLANRRLGGADAKEAAGAWIGAQTAAGGTTVTDWRLSRATKIGAKPIGFDADERALSVSVAPDGAVVLGTDFRLRLFDKSGAERHALDVPGAAWGVVVSGDGKRAIATLGDGTVRVYDIANGRLIERVAMFLHRDLKRWVAWLPEGFFDHSDEGGRELVGYALNRKRAETPEWVSFAQVYRLFYAPELVKDRLAGRSAAEPAIAARLQELGDVRKRYDAVTPPTPELAAVCFERLGSDACLTVEYGAQRTRAITLPAPPGTTSSATPPADAAAATRAAQPAETRVPAVPAASDFTMTATPQLRFDYALPAGIDQMLVRYKVTDRGGGIGAVDFFLNDRNAGRQRVRGAAVAPTKGETVTVERRLALGPGINRIEVRAYDQANGVYGESRPFLVKTSLPSDADKPALFVLAAGVNKYKDNGLPELTLARPDAAGFVGAVRAGAGALFKKVEVIELYDDAVTPTALTEAFAKVARDAHERDTVLVYLSGHGAIEGSTYFYITQNVDLTSDGKRTGLAPPTSAEEAYARAVPQSFTGAMLIESLSTIRARNGFIFLDTCHSGAVNLDAGESNLGHETGRYILTAAASVEEALDRYDDQHGVFAAAVLKALQGVGGTAGTDGVVDNFRLGHFVRANVELLAKEVAPDHHQSARFKISSRDATPFPIVRTATPAK